MTRIQDMAKWVTSLKFSDIPESVKDRARYQILGVVAAAHAGGISPSTKKLIAAVRNWDGGGKFPLITTGEGLSLHGALFADASLSMAHDYDDYLFLGHTGHSAVFTSLLVALKEGKSVGEMIAALVAANEVGGRMGAACLIGPQNGQVWTFIHLVEAAAAASKLMGLDARQTAHAIAIALYQPNLALFPGFMGPDTKILSASQTSLGGLMAAELAREGFTGPLDVIENRQGFLNQFSYAPLEFMLTGYGKSWVTESIAYKLVPGCAYIDTAVDAMMMVLDKFKQKTGRELGPQDVREIEVKASLLTTEMNRMSESHVGQGVLNPISINFSIAANLAIMVLVGDLRVEHLDPDWLELHKEEILALCRRIRLHHDWAMSLGVTEAFRKVLDLGKVVDYVGLAKLVTARRKAMKHIGSDVSLGLKDFAEMRKAAGEEGRDYVRKMAGGLWKGLFTAKRCTGKGGPLDLADSDFSKFLMPFAAEVTIKTTDWKEFSARQNIPFGAPGQPWDDTARRVKAKFRRETKRNLSDEQIEWIEEHVDRLEKVASVKELLEHLHPTPASQKHRAAKKHEPRRETTPPPPPDRQKEKKPPLPAMTPADSEDLPPIIFEPVRKTADIPHEKPRHEKRLYEPKPQPPRREPERRPESRPERRPERKQAQPQAAQKSIGVSMRRARPGEKQPRPSKGAKRMRPRRP